MYKIYNSSGDWVAGGNTLQEAVEQYNVLYDEDLTIEELFEDSADVLLSPDQCVYWTMRNIQVRRGAQDAPCVRHAAPRSPFGKLACRPRQFPVEAHC